MAAVRVREQIFRIAAGEKQRDFDSTLCCPDESGNSAVPNVLEARSDGVEYGDKLCIFAYGDFATQPSATVRSRASSSANC